MKKSVIFAMSNNKENKQSQTTKFNNHEKNRKKDD